MASPGGVQGWAGRERGLPACPPGGRDGGRAFQQSNYAVGPSTLPRVRWRWRAACSQALPRQRRTSARNAASRYGFSMTPSARLKHRPAGYCGGGAEAKRGRKTARGCFFSTSFSMTFAMTFLRSRIFLI